MDKTLEIIKKIKTNRISTTEIADCLEKTGAISNVFALNRGHFKVGRVFWAYAWNESNWEVHEQVRHVREDDIVYVESFECNDRAIFGELVSKFILLYKQAQAIVVAGKMRDIPHLIKENWPIWLTGANPVGCFNRKNEIPFDSELLAQRKRDIHDSIAVCDDTGVVLIPKHYHNNDFLSKLDWIEEQEDIWFDCIDRLKWDTYETVCLKKYLDKKG